MQNKDKYVFESFPGLVHLYTLKDHTGMVIKEYPYTDGKGKQQKLVADGVKNAICVLDFRAFTDLEGWKVDFINTEGLTIDQSKLINGFYKQEGDRFTITSSKRNTKIKAGNRLTYPIVFVAPLIKGKAPIAYDFRVSTPVVNTPIPPSKGKYNYAEALRLSLIGMTWQISGKIPDWAKAVNPALADVFTDDGMTDPSCKRDLSGGYHDAGDCIKVVVPAASNCLHILMGAHFYKDAVKKSGNYPLMTNVIKHYFEWFKKCMEMDGERLKFLWQWVSENPTDHATMLPCSKQTEQYYKPRGLYRKCFAIGEGKEAVGEEPPSLMAAAFAMGSLLFKTEDPNYAQDLLKRARILRDFAHARRGKFTAHRVYESVSYGEEITLANVCLYLATNEQKYLQEAEKLYYTHNDNNPSWTWVTDNHSSITTFLLAHATKKQEYLSRASGWIDSWLKGTAGVRSHGGGSPLRSNSDWGTLNQNFSAFGQGVFANDYLGQKNQTVVDYARKVMDYGLGDNPKGFSWLIGFGNNYPRNPHHRTAMNEGGNGKVDVKGLWSAGEKQPGIHTYNDSKDDWVTNELGGGNNTTSIMLLSMLVHHYQRL